MLSLGCILISDLILISSCIYFQVAMTVLFLVALFSTLNGFCMRYRHLCKDSYIWMTCNSYPEVEDISKVANAIKKNSKC